MFFLSKPLSIRRLSVLTHDINSNLAYIFFVFSQQTLEYEEVIRKLQQEVHLKTLQLEQVQRTFTQKPGEWVEKQTIVNLQSNVSSFLKGIFTQIYLCGLIYSRATGKKIS